VTEVRKWTIPADTCLYVNSVCS